MKTLSLFLLATFSSSAFACGGLVDLGGGGGESPTRGEPTDPARAKGTTDDPPKPRGDCGSIAPDPVEIFRATSGSKAFNVMRIASDGTHVYLSGHPPIYGGGGLDPVPDPNDPMKTATLLRVPVAGGTTEVVDYEHRGASRGVALDADNVYWGSEDDDLAILVRSKKGGPITSFGLQGGGIVHGVATDGNGNLFWSQWFGGIASLPAGATAAKTFQASTGNGDALWLTADAEHVYWIANRTELRSAPVAGGDPTTLASGIPHIYTLATDDTHVWGISNDELWKVAKAGGERVIVATPGTGRDFRSLAVTEDAIYFSDDMEPTMMGGKLVTGPIYKAKKDGSDVTAITPDLDGSQFLVADACRIYWRSFAWTGNGNETVVYSRAR